MLDYLWIILTVAAVIVAWVLVRIKVNRVLSFCFIVASQLHIAFYQICNFRAYRSLDCFVGCEPSRTNTNKPHGTSVRTQA